MSLAETIRGNKTRILGRWFQVALETYPQQSRFLIGKDGDRFANPIGFTLNDALAEIFDVLMADKEQEALLPALERLVKLRAVQDKSTREQEEGRPLAFLLDLKKIVRDVCGVGNGGFTAVSELLALEDRIDQVILRAHEIFYHSRAKLLELQVIEMRNKTYMLRKLAGEA